MIAYIYDENTKEFLYEDDVEKSPLEEDVILMPPNSTLVPIGKQKDNFAQIFNGETWDYIEDYRGQTIWKSFKESVIVEELGAIPKGWSLEQPEPTEEEKREIVGMLSLTRGDVFRGLLMAKQVTRQQIRAMIENNETLTFLQKEMALIDFDEALNFYRGNALIDTLGATLGITSEQLDKFFETNDYTCLLLIEEPTETLTEVVEEELNIENTEEV